MGMADIAAVLFLKYLEHCPADPTWPDRDRFEAGPDLGSPRFGPSATALADGRVLLESFVASLQPVPA